MNRSVHLTAIPFVLSALFILGVSCSSTNTPHTNAVTENNVVVSEPVAANVPMIDVSTPSAGFTPLSDPEKKPIATLPHVTIAITARGFSPKIVMIAVGGTVTWINSDSNPHQPASDPNPAHSSLPGFDARSGILPNESYQVTFLKAGTYSYHDTLVNGLTGTIVVR